jgi:hypothetical protein
MRTHSAPSSYPLRIDLAPPGGTSQDIDRDASWRTGRATDPVGRLLLARDSSPPPAPKAASTVAGRCQIWFYMPFTWSDSGQTWPGMARCLAPLAPKMAPSHLVSSLMFDSSNRLTNRATVSVLGSGLAGLLPVTRCPRMRADAAQRAVSHPALPAAIGRSCHDTHVNHLESPLGIRPVRCSSPRYSAANSSACAWALSASPVSASSGVKVLASANPWTWPGPSLVVRSVQPGMVMFGISGP